MRKTPKRSVSSSNRDRSKASHLTLCLDLTQAHADTRAHLKFFRPGAPPGGYGIRFPLEELTDEQKRETKELGLPLDGYNYLKHLRVLGSGRSELPISDAPKQGGVFVGSHSFVPPEPEIRYVQSKGLTVRSSAKDEAEAEDSLHTSTTTAFSRLVSHVKGASAQEVRDVEETLEQFEGMHVEEGDLLDSFVLDATQVDEASTLGDGMQAFKKSQWIAFPEDLSSEEEETEREGGSFDRRGVGRSRFSGGGAESHGSFSERWRGVDPSDFEGRKEHTRPLEIINEMFETVLEEYDDEEMGELDDEA